MPTPISMIAIVLVKSPLAVFLVSSMVELCPPISTSALPRSVPLRDLRAIALKACECSAALSELGLLSRMMMIMALFLSGLRKTLRDFCRSALCFKT